MPLLKRNSRIVMCSMTTDNVHCVNIADVVVGIACTNSECDSNTNAEGLCNACLPSVFYTVVKCEKCGARMNTTEPVDLSYVF